MKKVLIADSHPLFREFLKQKLVDNQIEVIFTQENRDIFPKLISSLPNLVILDMDYDNEVEMEFLQEKLHDSNTASIPVIVTGPKMERANIAALAKYGVIKYFEKPVQFDMLFKSIGIVVHTPLVMDTTPCVLDLHHNNDIIFVELALGMNREKIALLQFKLSEMIEKNNIENPKVIIMLTNLDLTFVDGYNLEYLLDNILAAPSVKHKNVKVLSLSPFVKELLKGHDNYNGIEYSTNLPHILKELVGLAGTGNVPDLITNKILTQSFQEEGSESVETRFSSDSLDGVSSNGNGTVLTVAIVDDDQGSREIERSAFEQAGATCTGYSSCTEFLEDYQDDKFDLIIVDVLIGDQRGLSLLQNLQRNPYAPPVVVYSRALTKETIAKVFQTGIKSFIVKPQKPAVLVQKSLAALKANQ